MIFGNVSAKKVAEYRPMDVDYIRSRFIQENLRRAIEEKDKERAARALSAFTVYFQWFEHRMPDFERLRILTQLNKLEEVKAPNRNPQGKN